MPAWLTSESRLRWTAWKLDLDKSELLLLWGKGSPRRDLSIMAMMVLTHQWLTLNDKLSSQKNSSVVREVAQSGVEVIWDWPNRSLIHNDMKWVHFCVPQPGVHGATHSLNYRVMSPHHPTCTLYTPVFHPHPRIKTVEFQHLAIVLQKGDKHKQR